MYDGEFNLWCGPGTDRQRGEYAGEKCGVKMKEEEENGDAFEVEVEKKIILTFF